MLTAGTLQDGQDLQWVTTIEARAPGGIAFNNGPATTLQILPTSITVAGGSLTWGSAMTQLAKARAASVSSSVIYQRPSSDRAGFSPRRR